jgi:hypothetical protein
LRLPAALPLAIVFGAALLVRAAGILEPREDLRVFYAGAITLTVASFDVFARRRGKAIAPWIGLSFAAFSAFIVLVPILHLYAITRLTNRVEHFGAFALLGSGMVAMVRMFRSSDALAYGAIAVAWLVGWANEVIEYFIGAHPAFFDRETVLDLTMNTAALALVALVVAVRGRAEPQTQRE